MVMFTCFSTLKEHPLLPTETKTDMYNMNDDKKVALVIYSISDKLWFTKQL